MPLNSHHSTLYPGEGLLVPPRRGLRLVKGGRQLLGSHSLLLL